MTHTAKIRAKGLGGTGYTDQHAKEDAGALGSHRLVLVDMQAIEKVEEAEGDVQVHFVIDQLEVIPDHMEDAVRELIRALWQQRPEVQGQEVLKGVPEGRSPEDALAGVQAAAGTGEDEDLPTGPEWGDPEPGGEDPAAGEYDGSDPDAPVPGPVTAEQIEAATAAATADPFMEDPADVGDREPATS